MGLTEIVLIGIGLSADAFAVSICRGLNYSKCNYKVSFLLGTCFGLFQFLMPLLGYTLSSSFYKYIEFIDHWIVFFILLFIGINMIITREEEKIDNVLNFKSVILLGIATSIDAFAVGITFSLLEVNILIPVMIIGLITFSLSFLGVLVGSIFGNKFQYKSKILGGIILIFIGLKVLIEHLLK